MMLPELKCLATKRDAPYQSFLKTFIAESLDEELQGLGQRVGVVPHRRAAPCPTQNNKEITVIKAATIRGFGDVADYKWGIQQVRAGRIKPLLDRTLPLSQAAEAHRLLSTNQVTGNIVLLPWAESQRGG